MTGLKNHPGFWLREDAASAFNSAEADHGIFAVNSAGRTEAQQQSLINRWDEGGKHNRPPYLYAPARPAAASNHVRNGGIAIDIGNWRKFAVICENYGFEHSYPIGDPVHFNYTGGFAPSAADQTTKDRQTFLNTRGWSLVEDGRYGPLTKQAYKEYQTYLKDRGWYTGAIDGIWGPATQAAHVTLIQELKAAKPKPKPTSPLPKASNPFGISDVRGLQKVANLYGGGTAIDNDWGPKSAKGFTEFLKVGYRYSGNDVLGPVMWASIARWLRSRWGYVGNDTPGPVMRSSLTKANTANYKQL